MKCFTLKGSPVEKICESVTSDYLILDTDASAIRKYLIQRLGLLAYLQLILTAFFSQRDPFITELTEKNLQRRKIRHPKIYSSPFFSAVYSRFKYFSSFVLNEYIGLNIYAFNPDHILVWNGSLMPMSVLRLAAEKQEVPVTYFENGFFSGTIQVDNMGINGNNSVSRDTNFYIENVESDSEDLSFEYNIREQKNQKYNLQTKIADKPYIFVPMQVPSDMQVTELSNWIKSMDQFYEVLCEVATTSPELHFVVKEHPSFKLSIQDIVEPHPQIEFANAEVTETLIEGASAVITINSTVGIEAVSMGKKVITLGEACYNLKGLVQHARNMKEFSCAVEQLVEWDYDEDLRSKFLSYVVNEYLIKGAYGTLTGSMIESIRARITKQDAHSRLVSQFVGS